MDFWIKQSPDKPLFLELLWSRPEGKLHAGKLLIVGGNLHGFAAPAEAYAAATSAGIGTAKVLLPDSLQQTVGKFLENTEYAPSTPSGSFAQNALDNMLDLGGWADGVLLAGDFGRNSETAIALEKFITKYKGILIITNDGADYLIGINNVVKQLEPPPLLVISMEQLQKLAMKLSFTKAFTLGMDLLPLIRQLHDFTLQYRLHITVKHRQDIVVAVNGQISTTKLPKEIEIRHVKTAARASVWQLQNPAKPFEAITTSLTEAQY